MLGYTTDDALLAVAHTCESTSVSSIRIRIRIISARPATRQERRFYADDPRQGDTKNAATTQPQDDDEMPAEIDFSNAVRGKFYQARAAEVKNRFFAARSNDRVFIQRIQGKISFKFKLHHYPCLRWPIFLLYSHLTARRKRYLYV